MEQSGEVRGFLSALIETFGTPRMGPAFTDAISAEQAAGGATGTAVTDRRRAAARRVRQIASKLRSRGKLSQEESTQVIRRVTGELADLAAKTAAEAAAVVRNGRRALPKALTGRMRGRLRRALAELTVTIGRTATIVSSQRVPVYPPTT